MNNLQPFEEGFGTAYALALIIFLAVIFTGMAVLAAQTKKNIPVRDDIQFEQDSIEIANKIIESLLSDETPESDSPVDSVWETVLALNTDVTAVSLTDISSKLNPNFFRSEIIRETGIENLLFTELHTMTQLAQFRHDNGMQADLSTGYPGFFSDDVLEQFLTPYGYYNINISDEIVLSSLYAAKTGNEYASEAFRNKIRQYRINKQIIYNDELAGIIGSDYNSIYPVINAVPIMNIHYIPEILLLEILEYDFGNEKIKHPEQTYNQIIQRRDNSEIGIDELEIIFAIKNKHQKIFDYLGTKTWFWKIMINIDGSKREIVIAEIPGNNYSYKPKDARRTMNDNRCIQIISDISNSKSKTE